MAEKPFQRFRRFLAELKRRNVYQVAATYAVVGFVLIQVADLTFVRLGLPAWTVTLVIVLVAMGFPLSLVLAWAFERTPEGMRRTSEAESPEEAPAEAGVQTGYKVLVGLGLLAAAVAGGWYLTGGGGSDSPEFRERTVAVLPFQVSGSGADTWRDGMVSLLSTGLDGAAGLRAISDRTVLAAWEERASSGRGASTREALAVARGIGAQYAVVGSAVQVGDDLRLRAAVHESRSARRLGQVTVRGASESVAGLADSLARETLALLLEERREDLPPVDLREITSRSLPALKSYLAGERHFRSGDYEAAIDDYEAAVGRDSTFALAYARLATSHGWLDHFDAARRMEEQAYTLSDRLPARERAAVRANYLRYRGRAEAAADTLQRFTDRYPDDPTLWYTLGEVLLHGYVPPGWPRAERAFERAAELDPDVAAYHHHLVDLAFALHHDSALVARRLDAHPGGAIKRTKEIARDLVFGSEERRRRAWARIDTGVIEHPRQLAEWSLLHPADAELANRVLRRLRTRSDVEDDYMMWLSVLNEQRQGHVRDALVLLEEGLPPEFRTCTLATWQMLGVPVPDSAWGNREEALGLEPDTLTERAVGRVYCAGLRMAAEGRSAELGKLVAYLRGIHTPAEVPGDVPERAADELDAYRAWKAGNSQRASELWPERDLYPNAPSAAVPRAIWRGDLYRELGDLGRAEGWYLAGWRQPVAHERLGQLYEERGEPEQAAAAYRRFIAAWEDADEELQPRVEAARERLEALTAENDG